jgi:transcriptional regulator with XRE-family HTH domain
MKLDQPPIDEFPLGERIRFHRTKRNMTQVKLGELCELSQGAVSQIEKSQTTPSLDTIRRIAVHLDVHVARLFAADDVPVLELKSLRKRYKTWDSLPASLRRQLKAVRTYIESLS